MKHLIFIFSLILYSCVTSPKYHLHTNKNLTNFTFKSDDKFVLIMNNFPKEFNQFSNKVRNDFSFSINNININPSFLEFNSENFLFNLNQDQLEVIKQESNSDYLILVQTLLKPKPLNRKNFSSYTTYEKNNKREYHVIIQLIDINNKVVLYSKESISIIKISNEYSTTSPTEESQLIKTYDKVFNDFKQSIIIK